MRINPKHMLFDQPILKIREVIRYAMQERLWNSKKSIITKEVARLLQQPQTISSQIIQQLIQEKYLVWKKEKFANAFHYGLSETEKGRRFGVATADPAITRQKADQLLNELIERAKQINTTNDLVYFVEHIKIFGSYLSTKKLLGDLDVSVKLTRKYDGDAFMKQNQKRISLAIKSGRRFPNYVEEICWPHREVMLMLKTRKKGLSLHDEDNDEVINKTDSKVVYEYHRESHPVKK